MTAVRITPANGDWSAKTVTTAFIIAAVMLVLTLAMARQRLWPDLAWSELVVPGLAGAVYLAWKHPRHRILPFAVFLPVCLFVLFLLAPTVAGILNRLFGNS